MALGVYGKHPAKGDFIDYGLPPAVLKRLEVWLDAVLAEARTALGPAWEAVWPAAPRLHFWLGEGIWGEPVAGVMAASRDRVGRRFPLVMLATGGDVPPPPVTAAAQSWHVALSAHLAACMGRSVLDQPAELITDAPWPEAAEGVVAAVPSEFWAVRPGASAAALWEDVALADHRSAAAGRSYWWVAGDDAVAAPEAAAEPEAASVAQPDISEPPELEAVAAPQAEEGPLEADAWALPDLPEDEGSPFASGGGLSLFAAPEPGLALAPVEEVAVPVLAAAEAAPRWSQVWAGTGLPSGAILAWFFRGHVGNG
ncbi:hypothetical protein MASR2M74_12120 [Paracoccaceae bacterium]